MENANIFLESGPEKSKRMLPWVNRRDEPHRGTKSDRALARRSGARRRWFQTTKLTPSTPTDTDIPIIQALPPRWWRHRRATLYTASVILYRKYAG